MNQRPLLFEGVRSQNEIPVYLNGRGLELTVLKKAEKEDQWIIRIVETHGRNSNGILKLSGLITECDLMEWNNIGDTQYVKGKTPITLKPFEIKTYKFKK